MSSPPNTSTAALTFANVLLALLVTGIAGGFLYVRFFYEPDVDPKAAARYAAVAKARLAENSEEIQQEVAALMSTVVPPIRQAVMNQAREDAGVYVRTLEEQGDEYLAAVEQMLVAKVRAQSRAFLQQHKQVLQEEFPQHASDENAQRVLAEFEQILSQLAERYYLDELRREAERTAAVWRQFEPVEQPGPDEPSLGEQLADYAADWAVLAATQPAEPAADKPAKTEASASSGE